MNPTPFQQLLTSLLVVPALKFSGKGKRFMFDSMAHALLSLMAVLFNQRPSLNLYLKGTDGWINFTIGFQTETGSVCQAAVFKNGKMSVKRGIPENADAILSFQDESALLEMFRTTPNEVLNLILKNRMILDGNLSCLQLFNYLVSLLMGKTHQKMLEKIQRRDVAERLRSFPENQPRLSAELANRRKYRMAAETIDPGVRFLPDPYLSGYGIEDFPRLKKFHDQFFSAKPEICPERAELLTAWFRENGFETDRQGNPHDPESRHAEAFYHLMNHKKPVIREDDLVAGTTTTHDVIGVVIYPDAQGTMAWGELGSIDKRMLTPYAISTETARKLHHDIFPFWLRRNFREWVRTSHNHPLCQKIEERWVAYFVWKSVGISHTIPDFRKILEKGTNGIREDIDRRMSNPGLEPSGKNSLTAMRIVLSGLDAQAANLSETARKQAETATDPKRRAELLRLVDICAKIPRLPALTLDEAVNCVNMVWIAINMENANTGLSFGRLDQWLQPYFLSDMEKLKTDSERSDYIRYAIELIGCLFLRLSDHLPLSPDIGNYLFGGASSTQALTLGGVTPDGKDGVNDMTYIMLKAAEMLGLRDVNVNARFHPGINTDTYLRRLCEVNIITAGTPSLHNDKAVFSALARHGYPIEDIRDWSATGCVEPTISGKHMGHTGAILFNLVAPLEMALHNGHHPLMRWRPGTETGRVEAGDFPEFEDFYTAYATQLEFLIEQAITFNNLLAEIHARYRPTPLLSALMQGPVESATDVTRGGATYNSSGTSNIGLADVADSLMAIKRLVYDQKAVSFARLKHAIDDDFNHDATLSAMIDKQVPKFGSGDPEALAMADRVARTVHEIHGKHKNFRGGPYTTGFWSMSQHVAYGSLSGALPSGRRKGKAFTPGLTPHPSASANFLDNIRDVAKLPPESMDNNIAFNVKINLSEEDSREKNVGIMASYVKTYFELNGMQLQFNVVTSEMLRDAMAHPELYRHLMVRISGYNAYFVMLNRDIQMELIERAEYGL
ncbi:MAG: formate acetyltransferase [Desulfobacteraceae bacterium]|nr:MAG: formate acetyltransferase [Desulfobacteraceae bacterium]